MDISTNKTPKLLTKLKWFYKDCKWNANRTTVSPKEDHHKLTRHYHYNVIHQHLELPFTLVFLIKNTTFDHYLNLYPKKRVFYVDVGVLLAHNLTNMLWLFKKNKHAMPLPWQSTKKEGTNWSPVERTN